MLFLIQMLLRRLASWDKLFAGFNKLRGLKLLCTKSSLSYFNRWRNHSNNNSNIKILIWKQICLSKLTSEKYPLCKLIAKLHSSQNSAISWRAFSKFYRNLMIDANSQEIQNLHLSSDFYISYEFKCPEIHFIEEDFTPAKNLSTIILKN